MIVTPHFLVGVAIASQMPEAGPAVMAAVTSHFILDFIPHTDLLFAKKYLKWANIEPKLFDIALGIILFVLFVLPMHRGYYFLIGLMAMLPDILEIPEIFWPKLYRVPLIKEFHRWHVKILQSRNERVSLFWALLPQILVVIAMIYIIGFR